MRTFAHVARFGCHWTRQRLENAWCMYRAVRAVSRRYRFDVLEMPECGAEGSLLTARSAIPTVVRFHSPSRLIMPFYDVPAADCLLCPAIEHRAIRRAHSLTSCSRFLADEVSRRMGVAAPVTVIPNGIDLSLFDRAPGIDIAERHGVPPGRPIIFFAGRMERRKGIHLCRAIAEGVLAQNDAAFVFAGGDLFGYMRDELLPALRGAAHRGSVHYLGKLDLPELRSWIRAADIFMLPSLWENCPYSCLEAMAARRAIVSSDQGGMPELIEDGRNGMLASNGDSAAFVKQISVLVQNEPLRRLLGEAARQTVQRRYTDEHVARLTLGVYERCAFAGMPSEPLTRAAHGG
jgi:glycosyltransferase involved in cell wall biosynthesis